MLGDTGMVGVLPWSAVLEAKEDSDLRVRDVMIPPTALAYPDEVLRSVADRMAHEGLGGSRSSTVPTLRVSTG